MDYTQPVHSVGSVRVGLCLIIRLVGFWLWVGFFWIELGFGSKVMARIQPVDCCESKLLHVPARRISWLRFFGQIRSS